MEDHHQRPAEIFVYHNETKTPVPKTVLSVRIHPSVYSIETRAFGSCELLARISMVGSSMKTIGIESFAGCTSLKVVRVPPTVVKIGQGAFKDCSSLEEIEFLPKAGSKADGLLLAIIEYRMFQSCTSLIKVSLPSSILTIEKNAFYGCTSLVYVDLNPRGLLSSIADQAFGHCSSLASIIIPSTVTRIGEMAFSTCQSLVDVQFSPNIKLKAFHYGTFWRCTSLKTIEIPMSVKMIGEQVFDGCTSLSKVQFHEGLVTVGKRAFTYCQLNTLKLPSTVQRIGTEAFYNNESLVEIGFPTGGITTIAPGTFQNCISLCGLSIPPSVVAIGERAFCGCSSLEDVEFQNGLQIIGNVAFANCTNLCAVAFPKSLDVIGTAAFFRCSNLMGVEIRSDGNNIKMDHRCFDSCPSLVNVSIPTDSIQFTAHDAFAGCHRLHIADDVVRSLRGRYDNLPIHQVLYCSSVPTVEDLEQAIRLAKTRTNNGFTDQYGLTPFHVLATSANPRMDLLQCLWDHYDSKSYLLTEHDKNGNAMMDYLLQHRSTKTTPLFKRILQRVVVERASEYGLEFWSSELMRTLDSMKTNNSTDARRKVMREFFGQVGSYIRLHVTSVLELALWKKMVDELQKSGLLESTTDRSLCRYQCGAEVVIQNVFGYLWKDELKVSTGLSLFPLCSPSSIEHRAGNPLNLP